MKTQKWSLTAVLGVFLLGLSATMAEAIPTFARKYQTSCSTCHYAFPRLNGFGQAFLNNGYRYPEGTDPEFTKEEPVPLGSEAQKRVFPDAIWPSDIAGGSPVSMHLINRFNIQPDGEQKTSFEFPHEFELLYAGTLGETFSYFGELELEHAEELAYGFTMQYDPTPKFHIKVGSVDPLPIHEHARLTAAHYNYGNNRISSSRWRMRDGQSGIELWGAKDGAQGKGGFKYQVGLVNGQNNDDNDDVDSFKDFYGILSYKIGGIGLVSGKSGASEVSDFWRDDHFTIGAYTYVGKSSYDFGGLMARNQFVLSGVNAEWWYRRAILFGTYMHQSDDNPKFNDDIGIDLDVWFVEGNYVFYPWLIGIARYEWTEIGSADAIKSFVPGLAVMIRANIKLTVEGQIRLDKGGDNTDKWVVGFQFGV